MRKCARCGLTEDRWTGAQGKGLKIGGSWYCCQRCSEKRDCSCEQDLLDQEKTSGPGGRSMLDEGPPPAV